MLLHNSSEWSKNKPRWYGLVASLILTSCATLVRLAIHDYVQPNIPFQIFYISIIISTFYFGWISGFLATTLSIIYGFYFFIRPYDSFGFPMPQKLEDKIGDYYWSQRENQDLNQTSCGYYCVACIKYLDKRTDKRRALDEFVSLFDKNTK
jgi:hypothetical protein